MFLKETDYAPVFIPTLCRFKHFKRCVDSLSRCAGAEFTTLIIGLDFPLNENHWDGYRRIKEYINTIEGFKDVIVFERSENYGALKNIQDAQRLIFDKYETCIYSEDDNEFSPNFLEFVNKGLIKYKDDPRVIAVCGYVYPYDWTTKEGDAFWGLGFSAWGVGEWKEKRLNVLENSNSIIDETLSSWRKTWRVFRTSPKCINSMITMRTKGVVWGDVLITVCCILNNKGSIYPVMSKVRNWGDDGSGLHCKKDDNSSKQDIDVNEHFGDDLDVNFDKRERFVFRHKLSIPIILTIIVRYLIYRLTHKDILVNHYQNRKE